MWSLCTYGFLASLTHWRTWLAWRSAASEEFLSTVIIEASGDAPEKPMSWYGRCEVIRSYINRRIVCSYIYNDLLEESYEYNKLLNLYEKINHCCWNAMCSTNLCKIEIYYLIVLSNDIITWYGPLHTFIFSVT